MNKTKANELYESADESSSTQSDDGWPRIAGGFSLQKKRLDFEVHLLFIHQKVFTLFTLPTFTLKVFTLL